MPQFERQFALFVLHGRDAVVAAIGVVATAVVVWVLSDQPLEAAVAAAVTAASTWLAIVDFNEHRLPNRIVGPVAGFATLAVLIFGIIDQDLQRTGQSVGVGLAVVAGLFVLNIAGGIGMGDVKFSYPLVVLLAWFGGSGLQIGAMVMVLTAGAYTAVQLIRSRSSKLQIPFGPFMALGFVVAIVSVAG